jgi:membrane protease YdiL (CAAX protease family)
MTIRAISIIIGAAIVAGIITAVLHLGTGEAVALGLAVGVPAGMIAGALER